MFLRNKLRNISILALLFVMMAFSAAFAINTNEENVLVLMLKAPDGVDLRNVTLNLYQGTGTANRIDHGATSSDYYAYMLSEPGTYNYRVTGNNDYYGVT